MFVKGKVLRLLLKLYFTVSDLWKTLNTKKDGVDFYKECSNEIGEATNLRLVVNKISNNDLLTTLILSQFVNTSNFE